MTAYAGMILRLSMFVVSETHQADATIKVCLWLRNMEQVMLHPVILSGVLALLYGYLALLLGLALFGVSLFVTSL